MSLLQPTLALMRLGKPIGIWLTFFPASWAVLLGATMEFSSPIILAKLLLLLLLGAVFTRSAGCILNDFADRKFDAKVDRTRLRPLASGAVSVRYALLLLLILLLGALGVALLLPRMVLYLSLLALPMIALYPFMKRITWWPQLFLGLTFNLSALIGWASVTQTLAVPALWLYVAAFFWTFGYDTIYAHQDIDDDRRVGIKSSALALGRYNALVISLAYAMVVLCLIAAGITAFAAPIYYGAVSAAAVHFFWQIARFKPSDPQNAAWLFKSNMVVGVCVSAGAFLSYLTSYGIID